ncbi:hypothetical protein vseg_006579 [Gypsophila vaccaria]
MVGTIEAKRLNLSNFSSNSSSIQSILYEPNSLSLGLIHSDCSLSLISSFSPFSISPQTLTLTLIPPIVSCACFVTINPNFGSHPNDKGVVLVTCGPHNGGGGDKVLLKFYVLGLGKGGRFGGVDNVGCCTQNGVGFDPKAGGVVVDVSHGMKVMLCGSINYFVVYSMAKLIVFGVRFDVRDGKREELRLVKCAVIECQFPIISICVSFGFLVLGEMGGVRVFPLRVLVKGKVGGRRKARLGRGKVEDANGERKKEVGVELVERKVKALNGFVKPVLERREVGKNGMSVNSLKLVVNGYVQNVAKELPNANADDNNHGTVKPRSLKLRQDSAEWGMQFVSFSSTNDEGVKSRESHNMTPMAVSILAVSPKKFLVLNSKGDLHVLYLPKTGSGQMTHLPGTIEVQKFAAFPDTSNNLRVWISDGLNSVHILTMPCSDATDNEISSNSEEVISHCSVTQAIFTSEIIKDMVAVSPNTVLLLGQDCLYAYEIS